MNRSFSVWVLILLFLCAGGAQAASSASSSLGRAESCLRTVEKSLPDPKKESRKWEQCIQKFKIAMKDADAASRAAFGLGELYLSRFQQGDNPKDLKAAAEQYRRVIDLPRSEPWTTRAQIRLKTVAALKPGEAGASVLGELRYWSYPDYTRIVFDVDPLPQFQKEAEEKGLTVRLANTRPAGQVPENVLIQDGIAKEIRVQREGESTKVSILFGDPTTEKLFSLSNPDRIVIDLVRNTAPAPAGRKRQPSLQDQINPIVKSSFGTVPKLDVRTIVIDPGHGGKDPGAIGPGGLAEKDIVLDIALRLRKLLIERSKKTVVMTRSRDVFIPLEERTLLANGKGADLFISIHTNASPRRNTRGIEIYLLGRATDAQAMETAARENSSSAEAADDLQRVILNDLESDFNLNESLELAHSVRGAIAEKVIPRYPTPDLGVKRAPFFVLANSRMPAILAELSFVSNPVEERRLRSQSYRQELAEALFAGLEEYIASFKVSF